jgi:O-antigen ligase
VSQLLKNPVKVGAPAWVRLGSWLLLAVFVAMLAGRFTLGRLGESLPDFDLRLGFLYVIALGVSLWMAGGREHIPKPLRIAGAGLFSGWVLWLAFSSMWSPEGARVGATLTDLALLFAFTWLAWFLMRRLPAESTAKIWKWMLVAGLIYFALAMAAGPGAQGRYAAPGGGPNVFVRIMVLASVASLYFTSVKKKTIYLLPVPLFAVGAALSGSRGGLLSAAIILLVFLFPICRQLGAKRIAGMVFIGAVGVWIFAALNPSVVKFVEDRFLQQTLVEGYSSDRDSIAEDALRLFEGSPISGVGLDGYFALQTGSVQFEYPHNLLIATMAESGTIGLVLILGALLTVFVVAVRTRPMPAAVLYAAGAGFYQFVASLFSGDYYDTRLMWFFLGLAAIEAARNRRNASSESGTPQEQPRLINGKARRLPSSHQRPSPQSRPAPAPPSRR